MKVLPENARSTSITRSFRFESDVLNVLGEEELYKMGVKLGQTVLADTIMFWKKETTEKAVMEYIEKMVCRYGHLGTYDERRMPGGQMAIVVRHRLGKNGSRFLEGYLHGGLKHTLDIDAIFEITESSVKCEIPARRYQALPIGQKVHNDL